MEAFDSVQEFVDWIDTVLAKLDGPDSEATHSMVWNSDYEQAEFNATKFGIPAQFDQLTAIRGYSFLGDSDEAARIRMNLRERLLAIKAYFAGNVSALLEQAAETAKWESERAARNSRQREPGPQERLAECLRASIEHSLLEQAGGRHVDVQSARLLCDFVAQQLNVDGSDLQGWEFYKKVAHHVIYTMVNVHGWTLDQVDQAELSRLAIVVVPPHARDVSGKSPPNKRPSCNTTMIEILQANHEAYGWTTDRWHAEIGFAKSTISATPTWKKILAPQREHNRASRATDRRRRKSNVEKPD